MVSLPVPTEGGFPWGYFVASLLTECKDCRVRWFAEPVAPPDAAAYTRFHISTFRLPPRR